jgi:hypothetical protein
MENRPTPYLKSSGPDHAVNLLTDAFVGLWAAVGVFGAAWISDDFDQERLTILAFFGIPSVALYFFLRLHDREFPHKWRRLYLGLTVWVGLSFLSGILPLLNAVTAEPAVIKRSVAEGTRVVEKDVQRGGIGMLFRKRF